MISLGRARQARQPTASGFHQMYYSSGYSKTECSLRGYSLSGIGFAFVNEGQMNVCQEFQKQPAGDSEIALLKAGSC